MKKLIPKFLEKIITPKPIVRKKMCLMSSTTSLACFGGGLLYFISPVEYLSSNSNNIYNNGIKKNNSLKIFSILFILSLIISFHQISYLLTINKNIFEKRLYYLFFLPIFSKIILKSELFKHQILSLFISIIGIILLFIPMALKIEKDDININILIIFVSAAGSFFTVMIKHLTHNYFLSIYFCLLFIGFFSLVILLFGFIIFYLINEHNLDNFIENFKGENLLSITYLILNIIFNLILYILSFLIIYFFSPTLFMVTDLINPIIGWTISLFINEQEYKTIEIILNIIGYFIVLFSSLIYNEIIICNFFGLNRNTKKFLEEKQREELLLIRNNDDDVEPIDLKTEID